MAANLLSGLVQGYAQAQQAKNDKLLSEELKKAQIKVFKQQLDQQEKAQAAISQLEGMFTGQQAATPATSPIGMPGPSAEPVGPPTKPKSLAEILADPEGQFAALKSGMFSGQDIIAAGRPSPMEGVLGNIPEGMRLEDVVVGPDGRPSIKLGRPEASKYAREAPDPSGNVMIQYDQFGKPMGSRQISQGEKKTTGGQASVDQKFADEYVSFKAAGGYADIEKQLMQLDDAAKTLGSGAQLTGPLLGNIPDSIMAVINPKAITVKDAVEEVVQRNLRLVLGAQFTEKEGERLIARAYNPKLSEEENKKRVLRLMDQIKTAARTKAEAINYFEQNGTLEGFTGKLWSMSDFNPEKDAPTATSVAPPGAVRRVK